MLPESSATISRCYVSCSGGGLASELWTTMIQSIISAIRRQTIDEVIGKQDCGMVALLVCGGISLQGNAQQ